MRFRPDWDAAPPDVWRAFFLVLAGTTVGFVWGLVDSGLHPHDHLVLKVFVNLAISALTLWIVSRFLVRRRWAWIVQWWLTALTILGGALDPALGESVAISIVTLLWSIPALVYLSRSSVRTWVPPRKHRVRAERVLTPSSHEAAAPVAPPSLSPRSARAPEARRAGTRYAPPPPPRPPTPSGRLPAASALQLLLSQGATPASLAERYGVPETVVHEKLRNG